MSTRPPPPPPPTVMSGPNSHIMPDGRPINLSWISNGVAGIVLRRDNIALKITKVRGTNGLFGNNLLNVTHANEYSLRSHSNEIQAYRCLNSLPGIFKCYNTSSSGIELCTWQMATLKNI